MDGINVMGILYPFLLMDGEKEVMMRTLEVWGCMRTLVLT